MVIDMVVLLFLIVIGVFIFVLFIGVVVIVIMCVYGCMLWLLLMFILWIVQLLQLNVFVVLFVWVWNDLIVFVVSFCLVVCCVFGDNENLMFVICIRFDNWFVSFDVVVKLCDLSVILVWLCYVEILLL